MLAELADVIAASAGSACHSDSDSVSGVLGAMGITRERATGAVRFSVGIDTTERDIARALEYLIGYASRSR
jgi:cysteine desulfurase